MYSKETNIHVVQIIVVACSFSPRRLHFLCLRSISFIANDPSASFFSVSAPNISTQPTNQPTYLPTNLPRYTFFYNSHLVAWFFFLLLHLLHFIFIQFDFTSLKHCKWSCVCNRWRKFRECIKDVEKKRVCVLYGRMADFLFSFYP